MNKAVRTRCVGIEHEDVIYLVGYYLASIGVPEDARIQWLALLMSKDC